MDYDFTANVEKDFDSIAEGKMAWNALISEFYGGFHRKVEETLSNGQYSHVEKVLGTDPSDGKTVVAKFGQYGAYVQKGEGDDRQSASLAKGQLIENLTLEDALELFRLPRTAGQIDGTDVIVTKGRFGPYIKFGEKNVSIPRGTDPLTISLEACAELIRKADSAPAANQVLREFPDSGISIINGRYGPYLKHDGKNYKLPRNCDAATLSEEDCRKIVETQTPTSPKYRRRKK